MIPTITAEMASPFGRDFKPTIKRTTPQGTSKFDQLFDRMTRICQRIPPNPEPFFLSRTIRQDTDYIEIEERLTRDEIQEFLAASTALEIQPYYRLVTGLVATKLVQNAHNHGIDDFEFDLSGIKPLERFGDSLYRMKHKVLTIIVHGELGTYCFNDSACTAFVEAAGGGFGSPSFGNANSFGRYAVKRYKNFWTSQESTLLYSFEYPPRCNLPTHYIQRGNTVKDRYIFVPKDNYRDQTYIGNTLEYYFCHKETKNKVTHGNDSIVSHVLPMTQFNVMWQTAEEPFKRLEMLFGEKR